MNTKGLNDELIVDSLRVKELLDDLSDKRGKIARMIQSGELFPLRRGLYTTRQDINPLCLAASLYGPSYISFETALAYYGLIPEAVYEITSATLKRPNEFNNAFGRFRYRRIPEAVYALGIERITESDLPFLLASPTKALCDRIALEPRMRSMSDVRRWAELMRLNKEIGFDPAVLEGCAERYQSPAVRLLRRTVEKYGGILSRTMRLKICWHLTSPLHRSTGIMPFGKWYRKSRCWDSGAADFLNKPHSTEAPLCGFFTGSTAFQKTSIFH